MAVLISYSTSVLAYNVFTLEETFQKYNECKPTNALPFAR